MEKKNEYQHDIDLTGLRIKNCDKENFKKKLENIPYQGYEVEQIKDGRKIVITKPGGKFTFGRKQRDDFMVWIYNPSSNSLWLISHKDIFTDIEEKGNFSPKDAIDIIDALKEVCDGKEPDDVLKEKKLNNPTGEEPEILLKVYKWIWGQEDINYPTGEGRWRSMQKLLELKDEISKKATKQSKIK